MCRCKGSGFDTLCYFPYCLITLGYSTEHTAAFGSQNDFGIWAEIWAACLYGRALHERDLFSSEDKTEMVADGRLKSAMAHTCMKIQSHFMLLQFCSFSW